MECNSSRDSESKRKYSDRYYKNKFVSNATEAHNPISISVVRRNCSKRVTRASLAKDIHGKLTKLGKSSLHDIADFYLGGTQVCTINKLTGVKTIDRLFLPYNDYLDCEFIVEEYSEHAWTYYQSKSTYCTHWKEFVYTVIKTDL